MAKDPRDCPCHSGKRYGACCRPYHNGEREAETPEVLMRSRYAAFALGNGAYLVRTLAAIHEDRVAMPEAALARILSASKDGRRYLGLTILESSIEGDKGEVIFVARIFEKGADRSFAEHSRFVREGGAWRYTEGDTLTRDQFPADPATISRESFSRV